MLGPPVCIPCKRVYDHLNDEEYERLKKEKPDICRWWCSKCGRCDSNDYALTINKILYKQIFNKDED